MKRIECRQSVLRLLNEGDSTYNQRQFENGVRWALNFTDQDETLAASLVQTPIFWQWWRNHWHRREVVFLSRASELANQSVNNMRRLYRSEMSLANFDFTPHKTVLDASYNIDVFEKLANDYSKAY